MKLCVSSIAWPAEDMHDAFHFLAQRGIEYVEIAPTQIAHWPELNPKMLADFRRSLRDHGLHCKVSQAVFYGIKDARLLGSQAAFSTLCEHLKYLTEVLGALDINCAVFGAPSVRDRCGLSAADAFQQGLERMRVVADLLASSEICLALEPIPRAYGDAFLSTISETVEFVRALGRKEVGLHLDTGAAYLANEDIGVVIRDLGPFAPKHFHISEPRLAAFSAPQSNHKSAATALLETKYGGLVSIELAAESRNWRTALDQAIRFAKNVYGASPPPLAMN